MAFTTEQRRRAFDRTDGQCHLCGKRVAWKNYGANGARGAWHMEHSVARANGGTDHGNNLYAGCIACNLSKGTKATRSVRARHGLTRAPLSAAAKAQARTDDILLGAGVGAVVGGIWKGWEGAFWGGVAGAALVAFMR